jgi:peroxiredoxin
VVPGRVAVFAYPRTGRPDQPISDAWNAIPGARGCTNEVCSVRDQMAEFRARGVTVFGLSAQTPAEQAEAAERLRLSDPLLSDAAGDLAAALALPTFAWEGADLIKRITLLVRDGVIEDVLYPVFPPDGAAAAALARL